MPKRPPRTMPISERAKIFAPFAALKGFEEALKTKEHVHIPKPLLSEDYFDELNQKLKTLKVGIKVTISYYYVDPITRHGEYLKQCGIISEIDYSCHYIVVVETRIFFKDILDIEL